MFLITNAEGTDEKFEKKVLAAFSIVPPD